MDKQELFDTVAAHLLTQNKKSEGRIFNRTEPTCVYRTEPTCVYRSEDGLKCAAGCLIPDDQYDPRMEGATTVAHKGENTFVGYSENDVAQYVPREVDNYSIFKKIVGSEENLLFLYDLQKIHDRYLPEVWKYRLRKVAEEARLEWRFEDFGQ